MPRTGDGSILDNYKYITLLSVHVPIKIFSRIVIQRLQDGVENNCVVKNKPVSEEEEVQQNNYSLSATL